MYLDLAIGSLVFKSKPRLLGVVLGNDPGKNGKPAPWAIRENQDRGALLEAYFIAHHPAYAAHREARHAAFMKFRDQAQERYPEEPFYSMKISKYANTKLRAWDRQNRSPLSWKDRQRLEAEFAKTYVPIDRS